MGIGAKIRRFKALSAEAFQIYAGFRTLKKTKRTPEQAYLAMRKLFVMTNGRSNDVISSIVRRSGYSGINLDGVLGLKDRSDLQRVVDDLNKNGFHVFNSKLPEHTVNAIYQYATVTPTSYLKTDGLARGYSNDQVLFDENHPISPRYEFTANQILQCKELQELIFDTSLLAVAQKYLATKPVLDLLAMWWSAPFNGEAKSEAAQMYHFDLDRIKFLKFFFYLTDVDGNTGPHCYVRQSHKNLPQSLLKDGRMTDQEVELAFGKPNMLELGGKKGTIIAVDTRGLHKGKDLLKNKRLLFQIEFSNCMFGQYYPPTKKPSLPQDLENIYTKYLPTYQEIIALV